MNSRSFFISLLLAAILSVAVVAAGAGAPAKPYDPTQTYTGAYSATMVYYRQTFRSKWRLGIAGAVSCPDALSHLKVSGFWKGHLKLDGSCGSLDEPSEWAVGNRLNYDAQTGGVH